MKRTEIGSATGKGGTRSNARLDLGVQSVSAVLDGKAEELVDGEFDGVRIGGDSRRR